MKRTAEQIQADCAARAKLWQEYVANYQKVLAEAPEAFSAFSAEFRERFLSATNAAPTKNASQLRSRNLKNKPRQPKVKTPPNL